MKDGHALVNNAREETGFGDAEADAGADELGIAATSSQKCTRGRERGRRTYVQCP